MSRQSQLVQSEPLNAEHEALTEQKQAGWRKKQPANSRTQVRRPQFTSLKPAREESPSKTSREDKQPGEKQPGRKTAGKKNSRGKKLGRKISWEEKKSVKKKKSGGKNQPGRKKNQPERKNQPGRKKSARKKNESKLKHVAFFSSDDQKQSGQKEKILELNSSQINYAKRIFSLLCYHEHHLRVCVCARV